MFWTLQIFVPECSVSTRTCTVWKCFYLVLNRCFLLPFYDFGVHIFLFCLDFVLGMPLVWFQHLLHTFHPLYQLFCLDFVLAVFFRSFFLFRPCFLCYAFCSGLVPVWEHNVFDFNISPCDFAVLQCFSYLKVFWAYLVFSFDTSLFGSTVLNRCSNLRGFWTHFMFSFDIFLMFLLSLKSLPGSMTTLACSVALYARFVVFPLSSRRKRVWGRLQTSWYTKYIVGPSSFCYVPVLGVVCFNLLLDPSPAFRFCSLFLCLLWPRADIILLKWIILPGFFSWWEGDCSEAVIKNVR